MATLQSVDVSSLSPQEASHAAELADWDARIRQRSDALLALTRDNTAFVNSVSDATRAQRKLEASLAEGTCACVYVYVHV